MEPTTILTLCSLLEQIIDKNETKKDLINAVKTYDNQMKTFLFVMKPLDCMDLIGTDDETLLLHKRNVAMVIKMAQDGCIPIELENGEKLRLSNIKVKRYYLVADKYGAITKSQEYDGMPNDSLVELMTKSIRKGWNVKIDPLDAFRIMVTMKLVNDDSSENHFVTLEFTRFV